MLIVKDWKNKNLFNQILLEPFQNFDELSIISGYASAAIVEQQLKALDSNFKRSNIIINLIVGMTPADGISEAQHKGFIDFSVKRPGAFNCSYITPEADPVHSKLYVWKKGGVAKKAFSSSANYTVNAFLNRQGEIASECDPVSADNYFKSLIQTSIYCTHPDSNSLVVTEKTVWREKRAGKSLPNGSMGLNAQSLSEQQSVRLPLFVERGNKDRIHEQSGLNWGQRPKREPNQAYIPIPSYIRDTGFFPPREQQFTVLTDDGIPFVCAVCQDGDKAIHSANNSDLGRYFRHRLGVLEGKKVELSDLDKFGNRYVTFHKISDEEYIMDFNPA